MFHSLTQEFESIDPVSFEVLGRCVRAFDRLSMSFLRRDFKFTFSSPVAHAAGAYGTLKLSRTKPDVLIAVASSAYIRHIKTDLPIIYCSDATFHAISRLYPDFRALPDWARRSGDEFERSSLTRASRVVLSSEWARRSAVQHYGTDPAKVTVLPFGPNIDACYLPVSELAAASDISLTCRLVFVGMDWARKGGSFALEVMNCLSNLGVPAHLDVVGRAPEDVQRSCNVSYHGVLDKNVPADIRRLEQIYRQAHFMLLPTTADATPVVFSEAAAFSIPSITFDVGGVSSAVANGRSGLVFPPDTSADRVARSIASLCRSPNDYANLRSSTFAYSSSCANWNVWAREVARAAREVVEDRRRSISVPTK